MNNLISSSCALLALTALVGCDVNVSHPDDGYDGEYEDGPAPPPRDARLPVSAEDAALSVEWTIDGAANQQACDDFDVVSASITIEDDRGLVDEADVECEAFAYDSPRLPPGTYWATVVLRDASGQALTRAAESDETDLDSGGSDYVAVDFTEAAFL